MSPQTYCPQLQEHSRQPCKQYDLCHKRSQVCGGRGTMLGRPRGEIRAAEVEPRLPDSILTSSVTSGYLLMYRSFHFFFL